MCTDMSDAACRLAAQVASSVAQPRQQLASLNKLKALQLASLQLRLRAAVHCSGTYGMPPAGALSRPVATPMHRVMKKITGSSRHSSDASRAAVNAPTPATAASAVAPASPASAATCDATAPPQAAMDPQQQGPQKDAPAAAGIAAPPTPSQQAAPAAARSGASKTCRAARSKRAALKPYPASRHLMLLEALHAAAGKVQWGRLLQQGIAQRPQRASSAVDADLRRAQSNAAVLQWHQQAEEEARHMREEAMKQRLAALKSSDMTVRCAGLSRACTSHPCAVTQQAALLVPTSSRHAPGTCWQHHAAPADALRAGFGPDAGCVLISLHLLLPRRHTYRWSKTPRTGAYRTCCSRQMAAWRSWRHASKWTSQCPCLARVRGLQWPAATCSAAQSSRSQCRITALACLDCTV